MTIEEHNIFVFIHHASEAHLIGAAVGERKVILMSLVVDKVSFTHSERFAFNGVIKESVIKQVKSENAIGWCTLYGDTAGAFSPTGDLYKSEMYDLARYINNRFDNVIPECILKKEPTSELRPNQKDSDILPPYEVVDAILFRMIEEGQHREEIINAGFDADVVEKIHKMVMQNVKKRYQYPPVLRLSTCSFRHECMFPLVNKYGY